MISGADGCDVVTCQVSLASPVRALPATSVMPELAAVNVRTYVPTAPVIPARLPIVHVTLSAVTRVCDAVSRLAPPLSVSLRSARSRLATRSPKLIEIELTDVDRGSGDTSITSAVGRTVSMTTVRPPAGPLVLPAESVAVAVIECVPSASADDVIVYAPPVATADPTRTPSL